MTDLHTKYRPKTLDGVIGQEKVVKSLRAALKGKSHSYLFHGPSGTGKTTLARIVAREVGCSEQNLTEVDAATFTGIEAMRGIAQTVQFYGMGGKATRCTIVDEAHALSRQAWQSLLKVVEEPPDHAYWCFCTTEFNKIPETIRTRCLVYQLQPLPAEAIQDVLTVVVDAENLQTPEDVIHLVAAKAGGSPRQALTMLSVVQAAKDRREAAALLREIESETEVIELCRALNKGISWSGAVQIVGKLSEINPESVRHQVVAYFTKVALGARTEEAARRSLQILQAFSDPYPSTNTVAPLLLSIGQIVYG